MRSCENCSNHLMSQWNYCPWCGEKIIIKFDPKYYEVTDRDYQNAKEIQGQVYEEDSLYDLWRELKYRCPKFIICIENGTYYDLLECDAEQMESTFGWKTYKQGKIKKTGFPRDKEEVKLNALNENGYSYILLDQVGGEKEKKDKIIPRVVREVVRYVGVSTEESMILAKPIQVGSSEKNTPERQGLRWSDEEDRDLLLEIERDISVGEIANIHMRTEGAIRSRINLGIRKDYSEGISIEEIAEKYKKTPVRVKAYLKQRGILRPGDST